MQEPKRNSEGQAQEENGRNADATSDETLSDVEHNEMPAESDSQAGESDVPSPDGANDDPRTPRDDAGPM